MTQKRTRKHELAGTEPDPVPPPVITPYQKITEDLRAAIAATVEQIPGYKDDLSALGRQARRLVPLEFLDLTIASVKDSPQLQALNEMDVEECRDTLQFSQAIQPLIDMLFGVGRRLMTMKGAREAKAGRSALQIYGVTQRLARNPNNSHLLPHVEKLKVALRKRTRRLRNDVPPPEPLPFDYLAEKGGVAA